MGVYNEKRKKTENELIQAFWNVYEKSDSLDDVTVKKVTEEAGVSRGTFYVHFEDITKLLRRTEKEILDAVEIVNVNSAEFYSAEQVQKCMQHMRKHRRSCLLLLSEKGDPYFKEELNRRWIEMMCPSGASQISGEKRFVMEFMAGGMTSATLYYLRNEDISEETMVEQFYTILSAINSLILS